MPAFPEGVAAPRVPDRPAASRAASSTPRTRRAGWYADWTARCLGDRRAARRRALPAPAAARCSPTTDVLAVRDRTATAPPGSTGCGPVTSEVRLLDAAEVAGRDARLRHLPLAAGRPPGAARRAGRASRARGTAAPGRSPRAGRPASPGRLLPQPVPRSGIRTRWSPPSTPAADPRPAGAGGAGVPRRHAGTTTRTCCPAPRPWNGHRHRRPVRRHARLAAAPAGQLRAAGRPRRTAHRQRVPASPSPGAGRASSTTSPSPAT